MLPAEGALSIGKVENTQRLDSMSSRGRIGRPGILHLSQTMELMPEYADEDNCQDMIEIEGYLMAGSFHPWKGRLLAVPVVVVVCLSGQAQIVVSWAGHTHYTQCWT